jgi:protein gp37
MAENTKIEWTATPRVDGTLAPGHTGNLWWGCEKVAGNSGCDNCYAETWAKRFDVGWGADAERKEVKSVWIHFMSWQEKAQAAGEIHKVFVGSMMDIFEKPKNINVTMPGGTQMATNTNFLRDRFFNLFVPSCPNLLFLLLTKRPSNINKYIPRTWIYDPPKNVMFGMTVVDPKTMEDYKKHFDRVNGPKFLSVEPQMEFIDFSTPGYLDGIDWLIQGGESGPRKRPFNTDWARHTRDVCAKAGVKYFFKQVDKVQPIPDDLHVRQYPDHYKIEQNV